MLTALIQGGGVQKYGKYADVILERSLMSDQGNILVLALYHYHNRPNWTFAKLSSSRLVQPSLAKLRFALFLILTATHHPPTQTGESSFEQLLDYHKQELAMTFSHCHILIYQL